MKQRLLPFLTLALLFAVLAIASPHFLTAANLSAIARQTAVINIIALGMTLITVAGGIDLSVGSMLALAGLLGSMALDRGWSIPAALAIGVGAGLACGLFNGLLVTVLRLNPFIVTLGTLGIYRGLALVISGGLPVHALPQRYAFLGEGELAGIPVVVWILAGCAAAMHVLLVRTRHGRAAFAIGSNAEAARYSGIAVGFHSTAVYAIGGVLTGLAAMIECSRLMTGQPTSGQGYELQTIAAVVIGGGSLRGGQGSVSGTLIGAFIMGLLANGSDLLNVSPYVQQALIGAVIIFAVLMDELRKRRAGRAPA